MTKLSRMLAQATAGHRADREVLVANLHLIAGHEVDIQLDQIPAELLAPLLLGIASLKRIELQELAPGVRVIRNKGILDRGGQLRVQSPMAAEMRSLLICGVVM